MDISIEMIKSLREQTGCGIMDCRTALQDSDGDLEKALETLREKGLKTAAKRADRIASEGVIEIYAHGDGRLVVIAEVNCETDFVGKSKEFRELAHEIALQIAASNPKFISDDLVPEEVIAAETKLIEDRVREEGKPENVIPRIVEGYLKKFRDENVLLNQAYIRDETRTINDIINDKVSAFGEKIVVRRFERWALGETTQVNEEDSQE
ncbi:MAG: translation elongation factor Ts [Anaerolineaceae bacterium]|nr:translation elongation factor Ts [Anaerolineaceae bacterium]